MLFRRQNNATRRKRAIVCRDAPVAVGAQNVRMPWRCGVHLLVNRQIADGPFAFPPSEGGNPWRFPGASCRRTCSSRRSPSWRPACKTRVPRNPWVYHETHCHAASRMVRLDLVIGVPQEAVTSCRLRPPFVRNSRLNEEHSGSFENPSHIAFRHLRAVRRGSVVAPSQCMCR